MKKLLIVATLAILFLAFTNIVSARIGLLEYQYLPVVLKVFPLPTNTPTLTPTITQPAEGELEDGYYEADLPYGGSIWFTVTNDGTKAKDGGFIFKVNQLCPWRSYSFAGYSVSIDNGSFGFLAIDNFNRTILASLGCTATTSDEAECSAYQPTPGYTGCSRVYGTASRR